MTLDDAVQECGRNTNNSSTLIRTAGAGYTGKGMLQAKRLISGINYATRMIARDRLAPEYVEDMDLNELGRFEILDLTYACLKIKGVVWQDGTELIFRETINNQVEVPGYSDCTVSVVYGYLPPNLTLSDLDEELRINEKYVDGHLVCQYANYQFLSEEGNEYDSARSLVWLNIFNSGFMEISDTVKQPRRVRYNG